MSTTEFAQMFCDFVFGFFVSSSLKKFFNFLSFFKFQFFQLQPTVWQRLND